MQGHSHQTDHLVLAGKGRRKIKYLAQPFLPLIQSDQAQHLAIQLRERKSARQFSQVAGK